MGGRKAKGKERTHSDGNKPRADLLDPLLLLQIVGDSSLTVRGRDPGFLEKESFNFGSKERSDSFDNVGSCFPDHYTSGGDLWEA